MKLNSCLLLPLAFSAATAFAGTSDRNVNILPEPADKWEVLLSMPGWLAGIEGDIGIGGLVSSVDYNGNGLTYNIATMGAEVTFGVRF